MSSIGNDAAMRARMDARAHALAASAAAAAPPPAPMVMAQPSMFVPGVPMMVPIPGPHAASVGWPAVPAPAPVAPALAPPPPQGAASLQTMDRCNALKSRINDRMQSGAVDPRIAALGEVLEATKDVYAHAAPFPPTAVYEVERVSMNPTTPFISPPAPINYGNPNDILRHLGASKLVDWRASTGADTSKGVLLMATECAAVVRDLQAQLDAEKRRCCDYEGLLRKTEGDLTAALAAGQVSEKERQQWAERHAALDAVYQLEKRQWIEALANERQVGVAANTEAVGNVVVEHRALLDAAQNEGLFHKARADKLQADNERLEHVLRELRDQMAANVSIATTSGGAVDKLTKELLLAKQQATFISTGYKKQDSELRTLREQIAAQAEDLAKFRAIAAEHRVLVAQRNDANARLEAMHIQVAENPQLRAELATLKEAHAKLTVEFDEKAAKAAELKGILDDIRKQANNAYVTTMGFNNMADALSPARGGVGSVDPLLGLGMTGAVSPHDNYVERLRQEIELEQRRADEERRRWRERQGA